MGIQLDHLILNVNDRDASLDFYTHVLGLAHDGEDGPFTVVRVTRECTLLLAPWGTSGGEHLAFAMPKAEFDTTSLVVSKSRGLRMAIRSTPSATWPAPATKPGRADQAKPCTSLIPIST